jgi:hypothetical protein
MATAAAVAAPFDILPITGGSSMRHAGPAAKNGYCK